VAARKPWRQEEVADAIELIEPLQGVAAVRAL
jgi:hypothetical protein